MKSLVDIVNELSFIPINEQKGIFYAVINEKSKKAEIESKISSATNLQTKFISLKQEEYQELYQYYMEEIQENSKKESPVIAGISAAPQGTSVSSAAPAAPTPQAGGAPKKRIGDLLKEAGYVDDQQLVEALVYSRNNGVPLGSALVEKGYITVDILKEVLHEQQHKEMVDATELQIQSSTLKLLPVDFIKANKVIPLSSDGKNIVVGMINPNDRKVLNEIVYITGGLRPEAKLLTHFEYKTFIDEHFGQSYKETSEIIKNIEQDVLEYEGEEDLSTQIERELQDSSGHVAKFVNKIILSNGQEGCFAELISL